MTTTPNPTPVPPNHPHRFEHGQTLLPADLAGKSLAGVNTALGPQSMKMSHALLLSVIFLAMSFAKAEVASPLPLTTNDFATVKSQFRQLRRDSVKDDPNDDATHDFVVQTSAWLASQNSDGSWNDIDYASRRRSFWPVLDHLKRTYALASVYVDAKNQGKDSDALRKAVLAGVSYWLGHDFRSKNWWPNRIGVPNVLSDIMVIMEPDLSPELRAAGLGVLHRSKLSMTGQNLTAQAGVVFKTAMLQEDAATAAQAYEKIVAGLASTTHEGLQADNSFHQHGPQQQFGVYGLAFASEATQWAWTLRGTPWAFSEAALRHCGASCSQERQR